MYMSIKKAGNPNWGGARLESTLIEKYADQWCRDNGYPIQRRQYVFKKKVDRYLKRSKNKISIR